MLEVGQNVIHGTHVSRNWSANYSSDFEVITTSKTTTPHYDQL